MLIAMGSLEMEVHSLLNFVPFNTSMVIWILF